MHGLNMYDYSARYYDPAISRFTTIDPLAEKYYSISPYVYVANNPMKFIDPTGMFIDDIYYNEAGTEIYRNKNDKPDRTFVIQTTQQVDQLYGKGKNPQKGYTYSIAKSVAENTENQIKAGSLKGGHMNNVIEMKDPNSMSAMLTSIKDDGLGGTKVKNNKEYSGKFDGQGGVANVKESLAGKPSGGKPLVISGNVDYHSHPSGTEKIIRNGKSYTGSWAQPPSKQDIIVAPSSRGNYKYVVGMQSQIIYIYNKSGVIATIPTLPFK